LLQKRVIPTLATRGAEPVLTDALGLAISLIAEAGQRGHTVVALGVGVCELVDSHGQVISSHTVPWRGLPIREQFDRLAPSQVEADSRAAAFAESCCGAGQPYDSFFYVTIGTGIGGSWVLHRVPFAGAHGCTGTIASSPSAVLCPGCGVTRMSVLEELASGTALVRRYNERSRASVPSAAEVLAAAQAGDAAALWVLDTALESLGATLGWLVNVLDPEALVIGGGLGAAPGPFWDRLAPAVRRFIWSDVHRGLPILQASAGGDSGVLGAALLAWKELSPRTWQAQTGSGRGSKNP
jgi:glucokinase